MESDIFNVKFLAISRDDKILVEFILPLGASDKAYIIFIDKYDYGSITKVNGERKRLPINKNHLTVDDIRALGERIDER